MNPPASTAPVPQSPLNGRYKILSELGRSGMCVVYLAEDTFLKRKMVLKIPQFEPHKAERMRARLIQEAQIAAQLSHINICQVYDVCFINDQLVIAMEYISGTALSRFTHADRLISERQAVQLVRKIAMAMEYVHERGLIHLDLTPSNIMMTLPDPVRKVVEPKIMGLPAAISRSSVDDGQSNRSMICGTPTYMSKEQWSGKQSLIGPQCDIYSLGIILYELLTGKLPYDLDGGEPATAWFAKLITQPQIRPTQRNSEINKELEAIVMRAITKEATDRYRSMAEFGEALGIWLDLK